MLLPHFAESVFEVGQKLSKANVIRVQVRKRIFLVFSIKSILAFDMLINDKSRMSLLYPTMHELHKADH